MDKRLFSETDLITLLIGLSGVHSALDSKETKQALSKLKAIIPKEKQSEFDELTNRITIDLSPWQKDMTREGYLQTINSAIADQKILNFDYSDSRGDISFREVEPYRLLHKSNSWYLQGFCLLRQELRTFRFSRIRNLKASEHTFTSRDVDYSVLNNEVDNVMPKIMVKIRFDETFKGQILSYFNDIDMCYEDGKIIALIPILEGDIGIRFLLSLGDSCECLEPQAIREKLIQKTEAVLGVYKQI